MPLLLLNFIVIKHFLHKSILSKKIIFFTNKRWEILLFFMECWLEQLFSSFLHLCKFFVEYNANLIELPLQYYFLVEMFSDALLLHEHFSMNINY